jgi:hypothetical protein
MLRPSQATIDPAGDVTGTVVRRIPVEEGFRLELDVEHGNIHTLAPLDAPHVGDIVTVRLAGGAAFRPHPRAVRSGEELRRDTRLSRET